MFMVEQIKHHFTKLGITWITFMLSLLPFQGLWVWNDMRVSNN